MKLRMALCFAATLAVSGCAIPVMPTTAPAPGETKNAPADRLLAHQIKPASPHATLVVTRDVGMLGSACYLALSFQQTAGEGELQPLHLVARLDPGETATFHVPPGEWRLRVGRDDGGSWMCRSASDFSAQVETVLRAGQAKSFRMGMSGDLSARIQLGG